MGWTEHNYGQCDFPKIKLCADSMQLYINCESNKLNDAIACLEDVKRNSIVKI